MTSFERKPKTDGESSDKAGLDALSEIPPNHAAMFNRVVDFVGSAGLAKLQDSFVVVVGLGGVGSHAAMALARSGVGRMRVIDSDRVTPSSLNRNAVASWTDVDKSKVEVMARHLRAVNPLIQVEAVEAFFAEERANELLAGEPDFVVDAIDSLHPKVTLLRYCVEREIRVVSSMGASSHCDPSFMEIDDIGRTRMCPLARAVRRRLSRLGIHSGITAIYSTEPAGRTLPPDETDPDKENWRGRERRRLPSLAVVPGIFGYAAAGVALMELAGYDPANPPTDDSCSAVE